MRKNISSALAGFLAALLLWCLLPVTAEAAGASFSGSGSVRAGDSVTVTFSVSGSNIQGITAVLHYDSSTLTLTGTRQLIGDSWSVDMSGGNLLAYDQSLNNPISGSSAVLAVTFRVKSGVAAGTKVSATITDIVTSDGNSDQSLNDASWSASVASPPSGNANLSGLSCGSYALSPSFSAGTTEYSVTVPYDVSRLPLDYSAADGGANVSVSGNQLSVGVNTVVLTVTAANGATRRYTISVTRQPDPTATLSSDADLADLTPSEGKLSPAFAPNITEYAVYVPYETTKLSLSATAKDSKALGVTQPDAALKQGDNVLTVTCTAEDGTTRDYTVHVVRMPGFAGTLPQIGEPEPEAPVPEPDDQQPGPFRSLWTALCAPVDLPLLTGRWVPLYAILALQLVVLLVAVTSPGGVFFRQERIGKDGRPFRIFKFRSMRKDNAGLKITTGNDSRITPVGRFLRKSKIDELPQLINVLVGDMSFVGPRPEVADYVNLYTPYQRQVLLVRPGITGLASIRFRNENDLLTASDDPNRTYVEQIMPRKIDLDLEYIPHASVFYDIKLIFQTFAVVIKE